jgi:hypothetical protein
VAIPLGELSRHRATRESPWAVSIRLHTTGAGIRSATNDASAELNPASYGWLDFD